MLHCLCHSIHSSHWLGCSRKQEAKLGQPAPCQTAPAHPRPCSRPASQQSPLGRPQAQRQRVPPAARLRLRPAGRPAAPPGRPPAGQAPRHRAGPRRRRGPRWAPPQVPRPQARHQGPPRAAGHSRAGLASSEHRPKAAGRLGGSLVHERRRSWRPAERTSASAGTSGAGFTSATPSIGSYNSPRSWTTRTAPQPALRLPAHALTPCHSHRAQGGAETKGSRSPGGARGAPNTQAEDWASECPGERPPGSAEPQSGLTPRSAGGGAVAPAGAGGRWWCLGRCAVWGLWLAAIVHRTDDRRQWLHCPCTSYGLLPRAAVV